VLALRGLGAAMALVLLGESTSATFWLAAVLMGVGAWLHLTEPHKHEHSHEALEPRHAPIIHSHPHFPDIHRRNRH